jgi:poly(A) polymerase
MQVDHYRLEGPFRAILSELAAVLAVQRVEAWATGGFLRDVLLGRGVKDLDITVAADSLQLGPSIARTFGGEYFPLDAERGRVRVLLPANDIHLDLMPLAGSIEDDLRSRDFTVDAIAAPLKELASGSIRLIDPTTGLPDLEGRIVRQVSEQALLDDPLRLLRGVRLAVLLDFTIEPTTGEAIRRHSGLIEQVAMERQRDELIQILRTARGAPGLRLMDDLDLLDHMLPELAVTRSVEQPKEHYWDVFNHSLAVVEALDMMLAVDAPGMEPALSLWSDLWGRLEWWADGQNYFAEAFVPNTYRCSLVKLAGLLHDIGKPQTKSFDNSGRMRFLGHASAGAETAAAMMQRLRFSSRETAFVCGMIDAHMRLVQTAQQGAPSRKAIYRFFRDTGEAGIDTLFLSLADHLGTAGPRINLEHWRRHVSVIDYVLRMRLQERAVVEPPKLVDGEDLMAELGIPPGPRVGELLELVREAQAAGEIDTREDAMALARRELQASAG